VADFDKAIPPGKEGKINIRIDGKKLFPGMFEKNFAVSTNDPENAQFNLTVQGTVKRAFEFSHDLKWTGFIDDRLDLETDITNLLATPVDILSARWVEDGRFADIDSKLGLKLETIEKGKRYHLKIWNKKPLDPLSGVITLALATDYPKLKEKLVQVSITVSKDVDVLPPTLYYGEMLIPPGATKAFDRTFTVVAQRGDSLKILKAIPSRDDITVKLQEVQPGKSYRGTVWVRPTARLGQYTGTVKIYTNYPKFKELTVDLVGSVRVGDEGSGGPGDKK
jgi:hypothetical protein